MTARRVIFMGTPAFACPTLQVLIDRPEQVVAVVTQPDRPKGRGQKLMPTPVKELALRHDIPVFQPARVRTPEFVETLRELKPDVIVVVAFGQILPKVLLDIPPYGCINVHASLLPRYRGAAPLNWCLINGEAETGVTTMLMDPGLDTGPMLLKRAIPLGENDDIVSLHDRMAVMGADLLSETLDGLYA
jgi:methionyl-tRNA formyltransferase